MKRKILTILAYTLLVVVVLFLSQCEHGVKLTTVKRDAKHIIELAQNVESEEELKRVEKLAAQYELAYNRMYSGAAALEFKRLTNDALREASYACETIYQEKERIANMRNKFSNKLSDLDAAWTHNTTSEQADLAQIKDNEARIKKAEAMIKRIEAEKKEYSEKLIEAGYPQDMLAKIGEMDAKIEKCREAIKHIENENHIIRLAYKLQGVDFAGAEQPVEQPVELPDSNEATEETSTEETPAEQVNEQVK